MSVLDRFHEVSDNDQGAGEAHGLDVVSESIHRKLGADVSTFMWGQSQPKILRSAVTLNCPMGDDGRPLGYDDFMVNKQV